MVKQAINNDDNAQNHPKTNTSLTLEGMTNLTFEDPVEITPDDNTPKKVWDYKDDKFWDTEPYNPSNKELIREGIHRFEKEISDLGKPKNAAKGRPFQIDPSSINSSKIEFAIKQRLRALGPGNAIVVPVYSLNNGQVESVRMIHYLGESEDGVPVYEDETLDLGIKELDPNL
jgi:hypothetical protein